MYWLSSNPRVYKIVANCTVSLVQEHICRGSLGMGRMALTASKTLLQVM